MAWGESKTWMRGSAHRKLYQGLLDNAMQAPARNAMPRKNAALVEEYLHAKARIAQPA